MKYDIEQYVSQYIRGGQDPQKCPWIAILKEAVYKREKTAWEVELSTRIGCKIFSLFYED